MGWKARVESENNFPVGAGIASSASAFAALTLAGASALGLNLSERELSILARRGSGSASRSVPDGFVEWFMANRDEDLFAASIAPPFHWPLVDLIAIVDPGPKRSAPRRGTTSREPARFSRRASRIPRGGWIFAAGRSYKKIFSLWPRSSKKIRV